MKMYTGLVLFCLVSATFGIPSPADRTNEILLRQRRDVDIYRNTKSLIEELVAGLREAASQAARAVGNFTLGVQEQIILFEEKLIYDVGQLSERVEGAIRDLNDKFHETTEGISECITSHQVRAEGILNETMYQTTACVDERIEQINVLIVELSEKASVGMQSAQIVVQEMHNCTHESTQNFFTTGSCLGTVLVRAEYKAAVYSAQFGLLIARINLALTTLPAAFEVCAGARLVEAGLKTSQLAIDISRCSISSAINNFIGPNN